MRKGASGIGISDASTDLRKAIALGGGNGQYPPEARTFSATLPSRKLIGSVLPSGRSFASVRWYAWYSITASGAASAALTTASSLVGSQTSSESRNQTICPLHAVKPAVNAEAWPPFSFNTAMTLSPELATIYREP